MNMKRSLILVNFKDYKEAIGKKAVKLAKKLDHNDVWLIVNAVDLKDIIKTVKKSKVLVEHVDPVELGAFTGAISFPEVKKARAYGVLLNHSEKKIKFEDIKKGIKLARKYKLKVVVSSNNIKEAERISKLKPDFIAVEPPELIGGKISVSKAKPELIKSAARKIKNLLVGAGIHSALDVKKSIECGAKGVLVSSAVVKSKNPNSVLNDLIIGLRQNI